ncbi:MAG: tetratricopeptide repeat protein [Treponema sp.]|nr:tetratricopeptide repeat protein [Treponema sp.]
MKGFDDFKSFSSYGLKTKLTKKQKIAICSGIAAVVILVIVLCAKGCGAASNNKVRANTFSVVRMYLEKGQYDRAMDKLDELLLKNPTDEEALALMDEILAKKNGEASGASLNSNVTVEVDTQGLTDAMQSSIESMKHELAKTNQTAVENQKAMADLLKKQQQQAAEEQQRLEEQKIQQKAAEEQRKKEEAARKAAEEALAKKNAQLKKEIDAVNDEIMQGKVALNSGNINSALEHFEKAQKNLPVSEGEPAFSGSKYSEIAAALYDAAGKSTGDDKKRLESTALIYAENAVSKNPKDASSHYIIGMNALANKDYQKAHDELTKAAMYDGKNYLYYYNLGRVQYMMKKFTAAKSSFSTSAMLNTAFAPARYNLGLTNLRLNDQKSALSEFRKAHDVDPRHEKAYLEEARLLTKLGDFNGAISAYTNVVKINNTNRAALGELGNVYTQIKKYADAESSFRKSLAMLPAGTDDPLTYYNLSTVLFEQGKSEEAIAYAKKAYETKDALRDANSKANVTYNYALLCERTSRVEEAIAKYAEVLQFNPNHLKTHINLGAMYINMTPPDADMALSLFLKAYNIDRNNFEVNNNLGSAYLEKKEYKNAILYFQNALKLDSKNNEVRSNLAQAFASDSQFDNAKTTYLEVLKQDQSDWNAYVELGKVCMALNDNAAAEKYFVYVQEKNPTFRKAEIESLLASISAANISSLNH